MISIRLEEAAAVNECNRFVADELSIRKGWVPSNFLCTKPGLCSLAETSDSSLAHIAKPYYSNLAVSYPAALT